ncbi:MAG: TlpA disulfide reductase family protein [Bacteroidota bacterium]
MKTKLITFIAVCLSTGSLFAQQKTVTLSGKLVGFSNQVTVDDVSEYQYLKQPSPDMLIIPDTDNKFSITFKLDAPNYFRIGRNTLYLTPGDNLDMVIDYSKYTQSTFKGTGAEANMYLVDIPFPKGGSFLEAGQNLASLPDETYNLIMSGAKKREKLLASVKNVSPEFRRLEEARTKADVLNSFDKVKIYSQIKKMPLADEYVKSFTAISKDIKAKYAQNFIDASLLKIVVYRDVVAGLLDDFSDNTDIHQIRDYLKASDLVYKMRAESDKTKLAAFNSSIDAVITPGYNAALKEFLAGMLQFGKGDLAKDFTAVDLDGKKVSLSSLKGKVVYVDIWATWCGPCLDEMPKLEEIKARYKDNPNVVFLSLSIDDDTQIPAWKNNVSKRNANGYQWQINRIKLSAYNVTTIPRSLLIDKDFKMASMAAPMPSAKDLGATIDKLLQ